MEIKKIINPKKGLLIIPLVTIFLIIYMFQHISTDVILSTGAKLELKRIALAQAEHTKAVKIADKIAKTKDPERVQSAKIIMDVFPANLRAKALKVAICESSLKHTAHNRNRNGSHDWGIFQLNDGGTLQRLGGNITLAKNVQWNVEAAYRLYLDRGWQPWVCAKKLKIT